ncbi:lactadherin-like [Amphiura filiformis]|uniref:lactadherin-like n=1 Tax=Amphiura filiformis TaxID=82378 RepID=UPI003B21FF86
MEVDVSVQFLLYVCLLIYYCTQCDSQAQPNPEQPTCQDHLGMEDGRISDSQITASTEWVSSDDPGLYYGANNARLNRAAMTGTTGAWSAQTNDGNQWIQVALGVPTWVTGVLIQGREDWSPPQWQYVTRFKVQYSEDGEFWAFFEQYTNNQGEMIFDGNTNHTTIVTNLFPAPVLASYIKIIPVEWIQHISMRFELVGCEGKHVIDFHFPGNFNTFSQKRGVFRTKRKMYIVQGNFGAQ